MSEVTVIKERLPAALHISICVLALVFVFAALVYFGAPLTQAVFNPYFLLALAFSAAALVPVAIYLRWKSVFDGDGIRFRRFFRFDRIPYSKIVRAEEHRSPAMKQTIRLTIHLADGGKLRFTSRDTNYYAAKRELLRHVSIAQKYLR